MHAKRSAPSRRATARGTVETTEGDDTALRYAERAPELAEQGFEPIPVRPGEKRPALPNWQSCKIEVEAWSRKYPNHGVGLRLGHATGPDEFIIALDVDVLDPDVAEALAKDADEILGPSPVRVGRAPKALRLYRLQSKTPPRKRASFAFFDALEDQHRVEVLGHGQQCVVAGVHPDTGQPYTWSAEPRLAELPLVTESQLDAFMQRFEERARAKVERGEWFGNGPEKAPTAPRDDDDLRPGDPLLTRLRLALAVLRPDERGRWIAVGHHIKAAVGEGGFDLWHEWSARSDNAGTYQGEEDCRDTWDTLNPEHSSGLHALQVMAEKALGVPLPGCLPGEFEPIEDGSEEGEGENSGAGAEPFRLSDVVSDEIAPRDWIVPRLALRGAVTVLAGAGAVAKSTFALGVAVSLAADRDVLGLGVTKRARAYVLNNEDPPDELQRRGHAICQEHGIPPADLDGWLALRSGYGRTVRLIDAHGRLTEEGIRLERDLAGFDVAILDPFVSLHRVAAENGTAEMDAVMDGLKRIAARAGVALIVLHHVRKSNGGDPSDVENIRGASSILNAARIGAVLHHLPERQAQSLGLSKETAASVRVLTYGKENLSPANREGQLFELVGARLPNGDAVGVPRAFIVAVEDEAEREDFDEMILGFLRRTYRLGLNASVSRGGKQTAWHLFRDLPDCPETLRDEGAKRRIETALVRLAEAGRIRSEEYDSYGHKRSRWAPTDE